jgi:DNA-binding transcriptional regulator YiaG
MTHRGRPRLTRYTREARRIAGAKVLEARRRLGVSQQRFGALLGLSQRCVSYLETGGSVRLDSEQIRTVRNIIHVD